MGHGLGLRDVEFCYLGRTGERVRTATQSLEGVVIDGGCSWHLNGDIDKVVGGLRGLRKCRRRKIFGFDSGAAGITTSLMGDVIYDGFDRKGRHTKVRVNNVLFVPEMGKLTLIAQGVLDENNCSIYTRRGFTVVRDRADRDYFSAVRNKADGLYHCTVDKLRDRIHSMGPDVCYSCLGHMREAHRKFGHISAEYLQQMGDFQGHLGDCPACKLAKSTRRGYGKASKRVIPSVGHTIVSDVKEMKTHSREGYKYIITFMDRKSRLLRVQFLQKKSEGKLKLKQFVAWVRTQRGEYPKNIHTLCF